MSTILPYQALYVSDDVPAGSTDYALTDYPTSKTIRVISYQLLAGGAATDIHFVSIPDGGSGTRISMTHQNAPNGGIAVPVNEYGIFECAAGCALGVTTGAGATTGVQVQYVLVGA